MSEKHDQEKPMYNLLPPIAVDEMAKVLTFGAVKYAPNAWMNVENGLERYRAALLRHTFAIQRGERLDVESGLPHSAHAMCCAAFIVELEKLELLHGGEITRDFTFPRCNSSVIPNS